MAEQLIRMLKLMSGPTGHRYPKKHYPVSAEEAAQLVAIGAAEIVKVPDKRPPAETATRKPRENADARPKVSSAPTEETDDARRARYMQEARDAGVEENVLAAEVDNRLMFDMLVADGADRAAAATEVWGASPPSHPWIPQPAGRGRSGGK